MPLPSPPPFLREIVARLPQFPPAAAAAFALNLALGDSLSGRRLPAAGGKVFALAVRDAGLTLVFRVEDEGVVACGGALPDVTIAADAADFLSLARREQDPDTLFFNRRLLIEGDTELGLLVKNALDALDLRALKLPAPSRILCALRLQLRAAVF